MDLVQTRPKLKTVLVPQTASLSDKTMSLADDDDEQIDWGFDDDDEPAVVPPAAADEVAQQHLPAPYFAAVSPARAPATPPAAADVGSPSQVEVSSSTATVVGPGDGSQGGSLVDLEGLVKTRF